MTDTDDIEPILDDWLGDDVDRLPDRSIDAVLATIRTTSQRGAWRTPWRALALHHSLRLAAAGGAVIAIALVAGGLFIAGAGGIGRGVTPSPPAPSVDRVPSVAPDSSPAATATSPVAGYPTPLGAALVELDGTVRQDLGLPADAWAPDLTTDGQRVIFVTRSKDIISCFGCFPGPSPVVVKLGSTSGIYLCCELTGFTQAAWSPDGKKVAYQAAAPDGNLDVYVIPVDASTRDISTGTAIRLTADAAADGWPAWSPDGKTIYYVNDGAQSGQTVEAGGFSPTQEIWRVPAGGGTPQRLTDNAVSDLQPDVAQDGTVAYWEDGRIMTMAADGTRQSPLAAIPPDTGFNPRWSPDGSKVALLQFDPSDPDAHPDIDPALAWPPELPLLHVVVADRATGEVTRVGPRVASFYNPVSWTPDGTALLIARYDGGR
jgi:dipeptidyl aminopeptidase/acylaminoacyl peptidase